MINVTNTVKIYETNGKEHLTLPAPYLTIKSHWNNNKLINIEVGRDTFCVSAADLLAAISNATNTAK